MLAAGALTLAAENLVDDAFKKSGVIIPDIPAKIGLETTVWFTNLFAI